jgi:hypothetical protein
MNKKMTDWLKKSTVREQEALAEDAGTSRQYLFHIGTGFRCAGADMAGRIEVAAAKLRRYSKNRLPELLRKDLCSACAKCPYAKKVRR